MPERVRTLWRKPAEGKCKDWGVSIQALLCFFNGLLWIISVCSMGFGLSVGLYSKTIGMSENFDTLDWIITTPATIFIFYGLFLFLVGCPGCFVAVCGNIWCTIFYAALICGFLVLDIVYGISFASKMDAYNKFIGNLNGSMNAFETSSDYEPLLLFVTPTTLWNHLHKKGNCCGFKGHTDWKNTPYGKQKFSLPDTCCGEFFKGCGVAFLDQDLEDDEGEWDTLVEEFEAAPNKDVIKLNMKEKGCLSVFSELVRSDANHSIDYTGKMIVAVLLLCFVLCLVLIFLIACRTFRPANGLLYPEKVSIYSRLLSMRRRGSRVHPDQSKRSSLKGMDDSNNNAPESDKRVSFGDHAPTIIQPAGGRKQFKTVYEHIILASDNSLTELDE